MSDNVVVSVKNLKKTYQDGWLRPREVDALRGVSFDVQRGEIFGLLGPNGAGKTTFIKILLGIIRKTDGQASLLGYAAGDRRSRLRVGYLPERLQMPKHHTGLTALEFYGQLSGLSLAEIAARRGPLLDLVGLSDRAKDNVRTYSKGMQQRLGLAQALIHDPELLILDEPTDGLDPVGRSQVRTVLARLRDEGKSIFLNSHLLQEVELICDRVAIMDRGELKRVGPVTELTAGTSPAKKTVPKLEVEWELGGSQELCRQAISKGGRQATQWRELSPGHFRLTTVLDDQAAVDCCVDDLRAAHVSVIRMTPRRASLEQVFLETVSPEEQ